MLQGSSAPDVARPNYGFADSEIVGVAQATDELPDPILEAVVAETQSAGLLTAAIVSGVNALPGPLAGRGAENLKGFVPEDPAVLIALWPRPDESIMRVKTVEGIEAFFARLEPARSALREFFVDLEQIGPERAASLHYFQLVSPWRAAATAAVGAIQNLDTDSQLALPLLYKQSAGILMRVLNHAVSGGMPCLTVDGRPFLPMLPQRRRSARRLLGYDCTIYHRGRVTEAFTKDVSRGGFGLSNVTCALPDAVEIELPDGRRFDATVIWQRGNAAGVRLSKPLRPNDPLLWG